ncbi:hypothetical protein EV664_106140 [Stakelama pacifica]|uniref:Uncharacterized protein n=1 Tax=Stakelama pacifica TaxID=517720 RepID=A0A4R6FLD5_9SPHN|nr:hypothetical protein EV664_106140 [Stakelama pacifica]
MPMLRGDVNALHAAFAAHSVIFVKNQHEARR